MAWDGAYTGRDKAGVNCWHAVSEVCNPVHALFDTSFQTKKYILYNE